MQQSRPDLATRDRILDAARRCFAEHGFRGASLADIARQAGCSKPSVLYHFATKEALLAALLQELWAALAPLARQLEEIDDPYRAQTVAIAGLVDLAVEHRRDLAVFHAEIPTILKVADFDLASDADATIRHALTARAGTQQAEILAAAVLAGCAAACHDFADAPASVLHDALAQLMCGALIPAECPGHQPR